MPAAGRCDKYVMVKVKVKVKLSIAICNCHGNSRAIWDHTVAEVTL